MVGLVGVVFRRFLGVFCGFHGLVGFGSFPVCVVWFVGVPWFGWYFRVLELCGFVGIFVGIFVFWGDMVFLALLWGCCLGVLDLCGVGII